VAACALVNGNDAVAAKYLRILERTLFHRDVASQAWRWLSDRQAADEHFAPLRARKPTVELEVGLSDYACLLALVDSNPNNHMALDYLTAWCLLDKASLPLVAAHVGRFREAGYPALPGHVQEALMVWERTARSRVDLGGYGYDPEVAGRLRGFEQRAEQFSGKAAAEAGLQSTYGGTYMYYYLFAQVPTEGALSSAWLTLGNELYARGQVDEAIGYYRQALARHPDFAEAHLQLGRALAAKGRTEEAMAQLRQARGPKGSAWPEGALELPSH
jgi:tetratricopeptide (TPR) repeat protein